MEPTKPGLGCPARSPRSASEGLGGAADGERPPQLAKCNFAGEQRAENPPQRVADEWGAKPRRPPPPCGATRFQGERSDPRSEQGERSLSAPGSLLAA